MTQLFVGVGGYPSLDAAIAAALPGDTITTEPDHRVNGYSEDVGHVAIENLTVSLGDFTTSEVRLSGSVSTFSSAGDGILTIFDESGPVDNVINAKGREDHIILTGGNDIVHGGAGYDEVTAVYADVTADITATISQITAGDRSVTMDGIDVLGISLGSGTNHITLGDGFHSIYGTGGTNTIVLGNTFNPSAPDRGYTTSDDQQTINISGGTNDITLGEGQATISLGAGDDIVRTGGGYKTIHLGDGHNTLIATDSISTAIYGGQGEDDITLGGSDSNLVYAYGGDNRIVGGAGDDSVLAGDGNDVMHGGDGNDGLYAAGGNDPFYGEAGNDSVGSPFGNDYIDGGPGSDTVDFEIGRSEYGNQGILVDLAAQSYLAVGTGNHGTLISIENVYGSEFADLISGNDAANNLVVTGGYDYLFGQAGDDKLEVAYGAAQMTGGSGADLFVFDDDTRARSIITDFEPGIDHLKIDAWENQPNLTFGLVIDHGATHLFYGDSDIVIQGSIAGTDLILENRHVIFLGDELANVIVGSNSADQVYGLAGDDVIVGEQGVDILNGGAGADTFRYDHLSDSPLGAADTITDFASGVDKIDVSAIAPSTVSIVRIGGLTAVYANTAAGTLQVSTVGLVQGGDVITGGSGVNVVDDDSSHTLMGGSGNDQLFGLGGGDILMGGSGDDQLFGDQGGDLLIGGDGADHFAYRSVLDSNPTTGYDVISDFVGGQDKIDLYYLGSAQAISLVRLDGNTFLFVTTDTGLLQVGVTGTLQGSDIVSPAFLPAASGYDLIGEARDETLIGSAGSDRLFGQGGNDVIVGGGGPDRLTGGDGADIFRFSGAPDSNAAAFDVVTDFQTGIDKIDLRGSGLTGVGIAQSGSSYFVFATSPGGALFELGSDHAIEVSDILTDPVLGAAPATDNALAPTAHTFMEGGLF